MDTNEQVHALLDAMLYGKDVRVGRKSGRIVAIRSNGQGYTTVEVAVSGVRDHGQYRPDQVEIPRGRAVAA